MKKLSVSILNLFILSSVFGQPPVQDANITREKKNVSVSFQIKVPEKYIKRNYKQTITPVIFNANNKIDLPPVTITGKTKIRREKQERALSGIEYPEISGNITNGEMLYYNTSVPYQPWMKNVSLGIDTQYEGCCQSVFEGRTLLSSNIRLEKDFIPEYTPYILPESPTLKLKEPFIMPLSEYGKKVNKLLKIYFPQNISVLNTNYRDNESVLKRIINAVNTMDKDPILTLKKIVIAGFASPEGTLSRNETLSAERALSLEKYLYSKCDISQSSFDRINGGIDWDGLKEMVTSSNYSWKEKVLEIIDKTPEQQRVAKLASIEQMVPYKIMYSKFFPDLRNACYISLYYDKDMLKEKRAEASSLVGKQEYRKAIPILLSLPEDGWTCNMLGICYQMTGEAGKAQNYFNKAVSMGNSDAVKNTKQLQNL